MPATDATDAIETFVGRADTAVSEGDVAAGTGVDVGTAKAALYDLMRAYRSTLAVHEDGTLVYDFGGSLVPLNQPTLAELAARVGCWLWKGFSFVYKASLAVVLVAYAVTFVVLIIAAAIAASTAAEDDTPAEGAFYLSRAVFRGIFDFMTYSALTYSDVDRHGYQYTHFEPKAPVLPRRKPKEHDKAFIASVYDFVLGPGRVEPDPRAQRQEVAAFVRKNGGVLTVGDVQALSGMTRPVADEFFATFVAEQDGAAEVTQDGALYATFEELLRSRSTKHDAEIIFYWDEYEPPHELTGNTTGKNVLIAALAVFNLACSVFVLAGGSGLGDLGLLLGAVPAGIFSLFFAVPLFRAPLVWWRNRQQHIHNIRKRLFQVIFGGDDERLSADEVVARANNKSTTEEKLQLALVGELLSETLLDVGGDQDVDDSGAVVTDMSRLRLEARVVQDHALRKPKSEVIYTSG